jgi:diguanylate cyclase (GGDEF)-like protein/PAS domain S-box-containing protein
MRDTVNKEKILVVDDNRQLGDFIAYRLLPSMGYSGHIVYNGRSAIETIRSSPPSLILLDLELPDATGLDILRQLQKEGFRIPTVLFTAHGSEHVAAEAFRLGVQDYLVKPVETEQLEATITRALTETRLRQEADRLTAELKEQVAWLSTLSKIGQSVTSTLELDQVLRRIVEAAVQLTQAEEGFLALLDSASGKFTLRAVKNIDENLIKTTRLPVQDSLVGVAIRTGRPVRSSKEAGGERLKISTGFLVHSLLYVPIFSKGRPLGVLAVDNRIARKDFSQRDEVVLTSLVDYAAVALENASLYEQARRELNERKRIEGALRESEERYALAVRGANDGIWDWNLKTNQIYFSSRWKSMLGYDEDEIAHEPQEWFGRVHPTDAEQLKQSLSAHLRWATPHFECEYRILHKDGSYRWMLSRGLAVRGADKAASRIAGSQTDISERKEAEARLLRDATTDALTQLPNRAIILERLQQAIQFADEKKDFLFAVLFLDLDRFKYINDSLGHPAGDELLITVAGLLKSQLRGTDIVARLGGDEFVILLENIRDANYAISVAERIIEILARPVYLDRHNVLVSTNASIGIVLSSTGYQVAEDVLRDADIAMYGAKASGKGTYQLFDPAMRERILRRVALESDLQQALEKEQLLVYYQPLVAIASGCLVGLEALVQWMHPEHGLLLANEFIPLAQESGLITPIDWWVFEEACRQVHEWHLRFPIDSPIQLNVNLTGSLLVRPDLLSHIRGILKTTGLDPHTLSLEVTESIVSANYETMTRIILALREMGIGVQIDNFGTGNASLLNLKRFPLSGLKIDQAFIKRIGEDPNETRLARQVIDLAHEIGLRTTAEGVETELQYAQLQELGCDLGQGFLFAPPVAPQEVEKLLEERMTGASMAQPAQK